MESPVFAQLENTGYVRFGEVNRDEIARASVTALLDLAAESAELTSAAEIPRATSTFSHSASLSLGGDRFPCSTLECRLEKVRHLSQFAALYSDVVYVNHRLSEHAVHVSTVENIDADRLRDHIADDVAVLLEMRPLIESGRIVLVTPPSAACPTCLRKKLPFDDMVLERLATEYHNLTKRYLEEATASVCQIGDDAVLSLDAPDELMEHGGGAVVYNGVPKSLTRTRRILEGIRRGQEVPLSKAMRKKTRYAERFASEIVQNVAFELAVTQALGASIVTDRTLDAKIFGSMAEEARTAQRSRILQSHLQTIVPFLDGASPQDLLTLREHEGEAFLRFRRALNEALEESQKKSSSFGANEAQALYDDVIAPELTRLDQRVKGARLDSLRKATRDTIGWVGAIGIGVYSGLLPSTVVAVAQALGMTKVIADLISTLGEGHLSAETVRPEDYYFLWRVKQLGPHRGR